MKALTISQPYASMTADGFRHKPVENRTWATTYRGPLAIHAGKGMQYLNRKQLAEYPTGAILCQATLVCCFDLLQARLDFHRGVVPKELLAIGWRSDTMRFVLDHLETCGPFCWVLIDRKNFYPPREARGHQGLWEWEELK